MKYTLTIRDKKIDVPYLQYGVDSEGMSEGWADLFIRVEDNEQDIYTNAEKKDVWIEWLGACCGVKDNPEDQVRRVVAEVYGGNDDSQLFRTITIEHAYISSFSEFSVANTGGKPGFNYIAEVRRAPHRAGQVSVV